MDLLCSSKRFDKLELTPSSDSSLPVFISNKYIFLIKSILKDNATNIKGKSSNYRFKNEGFSTCTSITIHFFPCFLSAISEISKNYIWKVFGRA
ncbi:predicted protein [Chaetoceros tenuissimus]|uniref:Uncharacterized protein n=1 Tax=Chaetoceros tenuissimus TaxID=426638 RepID=A0AAD3HEJ2_9STRA|nr:predicted protein [Chaetoceros tenuissimus]